MPEAFTDLAPRYEAAMDRELTQMWSISYCELVGCIAETADLRGSELALDVATGTARIPIALANHADPARGVVGLDITPAMLTRAREAVQQDNLGLLVRLVCASAMDMPLADNTFDLATCGFGMHHLGAEGFLLQLRRVLKPGGRIVIACVDAPSIWRTGLARAIMRGGGLLYSWFRRSARTRAEVESIGELRTAAEWLSVLSSLGYQSIQVVHRLSGRLPGYPGALILKALNGAT